ncbi:MAG: SPOR domain-containing protein [Salinisphaeraceae bacterium]|nr:SPOR domain-containing protein [Salinisphaeraceae bacterium]
MDETLKRRLVGIAVISLLVLIVAWWLPDRNDGQKRLNPETLPTETRVYDINQLNANNGQPTSTMSDDAQEGEMIAEEGAAPPPDIQGDFGMALDEGATVAKAESAQEAGKPQDKPEAKPKPQPKPAPKAETSKPVEQSSIKPAPVNTTGTGTKQAAAAPKPAPKPEPKPQPESKPEPKPPEPIVEDTPKAMPSGGWMVQVGSYSKQENAESIRKQLAAKGYRVYVSTAQVNGTTYHRVRVGPYQAKAEAGNAASKLESLLKQKVTVMANN